MSQTLYDESNISAVYDSSRSLPGDVINVWMKAISSAIGNKNIKGIIDLGCGTGRFSAALASSFNTFCVGVDPSEKMIQKARSNSKGNDVSFTVGSGESIPVTTKVDMVYMSMAYHHLKDANKFLIEIQRVLNDNGFLVIRNATKEDIIDNGEFQFFPTALDIEMQRMPTREELINSFISAGYENLLTSRVEQCFAKNHNEFYQKIGLRGLSALQMITDEEFEAGTLKLKEFCMTKHPSEPVINAFHLFIFKSTKHSNTL